MHRLFPKKRKRPYRLSPAGFVALRAAALRTQPWLASTGPRTMMGKLASSQNALAHGLYARDAGNDTRAYATLCRHVRQLAAGKGPPAAGSPAEVE